LGIWKRLVWVGSDPETYARPFVEMKQMFVRADRQELEEQLCVPSEAIEYFKTIAGPAARDTRSLGCAGAAVRGRRCELSAETGCG
jgi:hypothetical protein